MYKTSTRIVHRCAIVLHVILTCKKVYNQILTEPRECNGFHIFLLYGAHEHQETNILQLVLGLCSVQKSLCCEQI